MTSVSERRSLFSPDRHTDPTAVEELQLRFLDVLGRIILHTSSVTLLPVLQAVHKFYLPLRALFGCCYSIEFAWLK